DEIHLEGVTLSGDLDLRDGGKTITTNGKIALAELSARALEKYEDTLHSLKPTLEYRAAYDSKAGTLRIEEATLLAKPLEMKGKGELIGIPKDPVLTFEIDPHEYQLEEIIPLVPSALIPEGRKATGSGKVELGGKFVSHLADSTKAMDIDGRAKFTGVDFGIQGFAASLAGVNGEVRMTPGKVEFANLNGTLANEPFLIDGTLENFEPKENARYDLKIKMRAKLDELARLGFAPPGGNLTGLIDADVTAKGEGTDPAKAAVQGTVLAQDVTARFPDMRLPVQNIQARAVFRGNVAVIEKLSGSIGRTSFNSHGEILNPFTKQEIHLTGTAPVVDLNELFPPPGAEPVKETKTASAFFPFVGPAYAQKPAAAKALPSLVPVIPEQDMTLDFAIDSLYTGESVLTQAKLRAKTHAKTADVNASFGRATMGETVLHNLAGNGVIKNGKLEGTFTSASASVPRVPLTNVKGNITVNDNRTVHLGDVTAALYSGTARANIELDFRDPKVPAFRVESNVNDVQANEMLSSISPVKDILVGTLDATSAISGRGSVPDAIARSLTGEGSMSAKGGKLQLSPAIMAIWNSLGMNEKKSIDFKEFFAPFRLENGKFVTRDLKMTGSDADWAANGVLGFDGGLDYSVQVTLNDQLSNVYRQRLGKDLGKFLVGSGRLTLDLRVTGNARSPKVQVDTEKLVQRAAENATGEIAKELENKVLGQLGGLLGGTQRPDSTAARRARQDSAAAKADSTGRTHPKADSTKRPPATAADSAKADVINILEGILKKK
ncbi:MAG TPA: AsmA-like C-terminal region-containing protein, partial [bacterium]|nr:AsmA-like C-terminal region-containing protein [bacterium]